MLIRVHPYEYRNDPGRALGAANGRVTRPDHTHARTDNGHDWSVLAGRAGFNGTPVYLLAGRRLLPVSTCRGLRSPAFSLSNCARRCSLTADAQYRRRALTLPPGSGAANFTSRSAFIRTRSLRMFQALGRISRQARTDLAPRILHSSNTFRIGPSDERNRSEHRRPKSWKSWPERDAT